MKQIDTGDLNVVSNASPDAAAALLKQVFFALASLTRFSFTRFSFTRFSFTRFSFTRFSFSRFSFSRFSLSLSLSLYLSLSLASLLLSQREYGVMAVVAEDARWARHSSWQIRHSCLLGNRRNEGLQASLHEIMERRREREKKRGEKSGYA